MKLKENFKKVLISCLRLVFRSPKSEYFLEKFIVELVWKSFSGRNNSLEPPVFWFCSSRFYGLEESRWLRAWLNEFWGNKHSKMQRISGSNFFFHFWATIMDLRTIWNTEFFFLISSLEEFQPVKYFQPRIFYFFNFTPGNSSR